MLCHLADALFLFCSITGVPFRRNFLPKSRIPYHFSGERKSGKTNLLQGILAVLLTHWECLIYICYLCISFLNVLLLLFFIISMENMFKDFFFPSHFSPHGTERLLKMFFGSIKVKMISWPRCQTHNKRKELYLKLLVLPKHVTTVPWFFLRTSDTDATYNTPAPSSHIPHT